MNSKEEYFTVALSGASGALYGLRLIEALVKANRNVRVLVTNPARVVISQETDLTVPNSPKEATEFFSDLYKSEKNQLIVYGKEQWFAPVASGSNAPKAMIVCPCSTGTLSAIAMGSSRSLLERAADVVLKERRTLILVPRESPYSTIQLENMLKLSKLGVTILPASPAFYNRPESISDLVDHIVARILDHLHVEHKLVPRWGEDVGY
ncbi:MAG: UbiX family flavin prenyltransferase [Gammaproteobacteria bacterium]|nr:UbiX family flavin prenyltransferase [Gammaproteobacteria bacterium]MDH5693588.1 UbiX family flavin prenyltransferase [Gammaproteobacteria bacterium]